MARIRQQRRASSYGQVSVAAPKVRPDIIWVVEEVIDNTITISLEVNGEGAFLTGVPGFVLAGTGVGTVSVELAGLIMTVHMNAAIPEGALILLAPGDLSCRNRFGGALAAGAYRFITPNPPPEPWTPEFLVQDTFVLRLNVLNPLRPPLINDNGYINIDGAHAVIMEAKIGEGFWLFTIDREVTDGNTVHIDGSEKWAVTEDGGKMIIGNYVIP